DDHQVIWFKPFGDDEQLTDLWPGLDTAALDYVVFVDDQEEFALLVEAERVSWHQQRIALLQRRHAHAHEQSRQHSVIRIGKDTAQLQRPRRRRNVDRGKVQAPLMRIAVLVGQAKVHSYAALLDGRAGGGFLALDDAQ